MWVEGKSGGRVASYVVPPDDIELRLTRQTEGGSFPSTESLRLQVINLHWPVHGHDYNVIHATQPETQRIVCNNISNRDKKTRACNESAPVCCKVIATTLIAAMVTVTIHLNVSIAVHLFIAAGRATMTVPS